MNANEQLIQYNPAGAMLEKTGISREMLGKISSPLAEARTTVVETDVKQFANPDTIPATKKPLDAGFFQLPEKTLSAYRQDRDGSELGRILKTAKRLGGLVDRVVVLGIGGSYMGARALMEACCQPFFNERDRGQRGERPRMYFEGNNLDNDAMRGLLKLLGAGQPASSVDDRWGIVVISKGGGTLETAVALRRFLAALRQSCRDDPEMTRQLVVPVTGSESKLFKLAMALGCPDIYEVPEGVGGRFSVLSPVGLLPAAILGLDVVRLLEGAAAMNDHFRSAPVEQNVVLQYVGVCHLMEKKRNATIRVLSVWSKALEAVGFWYDQLLAESLGKNQQGATPITAVNTRDLHSRAQQHQEGRLDKLHTNLIVDRWRTDPLAVGESKLNQDELNKHATKTIPELMAAAISGTNEAYRQDGRPATDIHLPRIDEFSLGQFFQMMMLATVVEGRLTQINPYGQPGVEAYKKNMERILEQA
ncbi:MAG: glucose-6-phosphate isomerase [Planctomycetota bacterium]